MVCAVCGKDGHNKSTCNQVEYDYESKSKNSNFSYLSDLIKKFFSASEISDKMLIIHDNMDITGWEKWMQIELSIFLAQHPSKPEWKREVNLDADKRMEKFKNKLKPDFLIRKKGWAINSYILLEIKQDDNPKKCYEKMLDDLEKLNKIKGSAINSRENFVLGVHKKEKNLPELLDECLDNRGYDINDFDFDINNISKGGYFYTLF